MTGTNESKSVVTLTYALKPNRDHTLDDLKDFTFNDVVFPDGAALKDLTFKQFSELVASYESKIIVSPTYETKN